MGDERHTDGPGRNRLLAALPRGDYERLLPSLARVPLDRLRVLHAPGEPIEHVYFPLDGVISFVAMMSDGTAVEAGIVGREGFLGTAVFLGATVAPNQSMVQAPGEAMRMTSAALRAEFERGGALHRCLLRFMQAMVVQISQSAGCNRLHDRAARLARWLLTCHDRVSSDEIGVTHEVIATMLGTGRPGVTRAVGALEADGLVVQKRGAVIVVDRRGLEARSCECYGAVRAEYARYLDDVGSPGGR